MAMAINTYCNVRISYLIKENELKQKIGDYLNSFLPAIEAGMITEDEVCEKGKQFVLQYMDIEIWNDDYTRMISKRRGDAILK